MLIQTLQGDCREILKTLPDNSVNCCVTSPPYFGLRDYGAAGQIGLEETPAEFVRVMVEVFKEVKRVLRPDGTLWLNLGDTYSTDGKWGGGKTNAGKNYTSFAGGYRSIKKETGLPGKQLLGIPWKVAFALQDDGWFLRSDIIWHKPNPMPESVLDRPTKSHEYIFLLTKFSKYYYDAASIREPLKPKTLTTFGTTRKEKKNDQTGLVKSNNWNKTSPERKPKLNEDGEIAGANKRTVWTVARQSYEGSHFATFPEKLIEPCILAGCPAGGTVLDPFGGSGTTGRVAVKHGRNAILIELNPEYHKLIDQRTDKVQVKMAI
jgi:DNA modification methylase